MCIDRKQIYQQVVSHKTDYLFFVLRLQEIVMHLATLLNRFRG